jgi:hypothetical protein
MQFNYRFLALLLAAASIAAAQSEKKLTARELFYTPLPAKPAAKPAAKPSQSPPQAKSRESSASRRTEAKNPVQTATRSEQPRPPQSSSSVPDSGEIKRVSSTGDIAGPPLALRYSLLKQAGSGEYVEVDPDTIFRSGDRLKISIESNDGAYLYIVQQGSSKAWNLLFPNEDTGHGDNRVERGRSVTVPAGGRFTFDDRPGTERLFIVLSRQAEPDLEKMIYDLSRGTATTPGAAPAAAPADNRPKMMLAMNSLDDAVVNRLRTQMTSRDLVFEKVTEDKPAPGGKREKAMYYGTQDRTSRARIVVDMNLRHQ